MSSCERDPTDARVAGVIVTYFPDDGFAGRLGAMARETAALIVVDNSSDSTVQAVLRMLCEKAGARLIAHSENLGLAAALNEGFARCEADGFTWALAFDQDSTPALGFAAALLTAGQRAGLELAAVGANWRDEARPDFASRHLQPRARVPALFKRTPATQDLPNVTCVITSGTLFHLPTWRALGGFDERLFLDLVDTEFCLRAHRAGKAVMVAAAAGLVHRRGRKQPIRRCGRAWWPAFMPPRRLRYLFRNRILVARRHGFALPHWLAFELLFAIKVIAEIALLEPEKVEKLRACAVGTWEGLRGRAGKIA